MRMNNKGFSLLEGLIALGLLGIVTAATAMIIAESSRDIRKLEREVDNDTESAIAERVLMRDLKLSEPSFNNVVTLDDNGKMFFEFVTDAVDRSTIVSSTRTLTMDGSSPAKSSFSFVTTNEVVGGAVIFDPVMAYDIGVEPLAFDKAATLTFNSLNKNTYLQKQSPGYWNEGRILMMDTPVGIRRLVNGVPDYSKAPRSPIFVGVVTMGKSTLTQLPIKSFLDETHPWYPAKPMTSEDAFLRSVPPIGGGVAIVRIKVVKALRYSLVKSTKGDGFDLVRSSWEGLKGWAGDQTVATGVKSAIMSRKAVNDPLIYFKITRVDD